MVPGKPGAPRLLESLRGMTMLQKEITAKQLSCDDRADTTHEWGAGVVRAECGPH